MVTTEYQLSERLSVWKSDSEWCISNDCAINPLLCGAYTDFLDWDALAPGTARLKLSQDALTAAAQMETGEQAMEPELYDDVVRRYTLLVAADPDTFDAALTEYFHAEILPVQQAEQPGSPQTETRSERPRKPRKENETRLNPALAVEIRDAYAGGLFTMMELAQMYNVSDPAIWAIINRKTYRYV